jgi:hypothetical protein
MGAIADTDHTLSEVGTPHKGRYRRVSGPSWGDALDTCAGGGGRWRPVPQPWGLGDTPTDVLAGRLGYLLAPQLVREGGSARRYGRPPLPASNRSRVELVAYAHDLRDVPVRTIARELHPDITEGAARAQARRDLAAGRRHLHDDAVLPWAAWAAGALPGDWRDSEQIAAALDQWAPLGAAWFLLRASSAAG